jgi:hypothetical protein
MQYGKDLETLKKIEAGGFPVPQLEQQPSVLGFVWIWDAFMALQTCRQIGMDVGPIPWTAIRLYAKEFRMSSEDSYVLEEIVTYLDVKWRDLIVERRERETSSNSSKVRH